jgi:hypothetical protein
MEGLSSLMQMFGGPLGAAQAGSGIMGMIGNITGNITRNNVLNSETAYQKQLTNMTPAAMAQGIQALQQPLSAGLTQGVGNAVKGQLAESGLSQAPGIQAQALAQGLAPFQMQEQQMATNAFLQKLGLPISARPSPFGPFPQQTNTSAIWQNMMRQQQQPGLAAAPGEYPADYGGGNGMGSYANTGTGDLPLGGGGMDLSSLMSMFSGMGGGGGDSSLPLSMMSLSGLS